MSSTFGAILDGFTTRINQTIETAAESIKNKGIELEIEAGRQLAMTIENTKTAYKSELDYTVNKISRQAKQTFDNLQSMVQRFENATADNLRDIELKAQQVALSLPYSNKMPQLTRVAPRYVVVDDVGRDALVMFQGVFPWSAKPGFEPNFRFNGRDCYLVDSTTQCLTFQVSQAVFNTTTPDQYAYKTGTLVVPWDNGVILSSKVTSEYKIGLSALPKLAGKGTVAYLSHQTERLTQHVTSPEVKYDGNSWYPKPWKDVYEHIYPTPGWLIDVSKRPTMSFTHLHGEHTQEILSVSPYEIVLKVGLYCKSGDKIGIVKVKVDYDQYRDVPEDKTRTEDFTVNWRDSQLLEPHTQETISKVAFEAYDGKKDVFLGPELDAKSVLKISAGGDGAWKIWAEPPQDLKLTASSMPSTLRDKVDRAMKLSNLNRSSKLPD